MMGIDPTPAQSRLAHTGAELLRYPELTSASAKNFIDGDNVIFVHGFTADCRNLVPLMERFESEDFNCFAYNYPCFDGIDTAAGGLLQLLNQFEWLRPGCITKKRLTIVAHSMGGLVVRSLVALNGASMLVGRVITLGTPHDGTLKDAEIARLMIGLSQSVKRWKDAWIPPGRAESCLSALQLMRADEAQLLEKLRDGKNKGPRVAWFSISGARPNLSFVNNPKINFGLNRYVQNLMKGETNDGLVGEESCDLTNPIFADCAGTSSHFNSYTEYRVTNHAALVENQQVANQAMILARSADSDQMICDSRPHGSTTTESAQTPLS